MKKYTTFLVLLAITYPQTALAHFETPHQPFWHEPMHWLFQHYAVSTLIGLGIIGAIVYIKRSSESK